MHYDKKVFADVIKLRILRWGGLSRIIWVGPYKREAGGSIRECDVMMEAEEKNITTVAQNRVKWDHEPRNVVSL